MKRLTAKQYAIALHELTRGLTHAEIDAIVRKFVTLLADRNQTSLAEKISQEFQRQALIQEGVVEGNLTTAQRVPDTEKKEIEETLSQMLKKTIRLQGHVDASVLGGMIVAFPDLLIDASLRTRLHTLKQSLSE